MKGLFKQLGAKDKTVIITLILILTAGLIIKYSGWNKPDSFDYSETDRQFTEKTKSDFSALKQRQLNELQNLRAEELKKLADSILTDYNIDNDKNIIIDKPININTAYSADLMKLPGIGEVIAERIIEYREKNGVFKKTEELMNVKGIGKKKFDKILPYVTVE